MQASMEGSSELQDEGLSGLFQQHVSGDGGMAREKRGLQPSNHRQWYSELPEEMQPELASPKRFRERQTAETNTLKAASRNWYAGISEEKRAQFLMKVKAKSDQRKANMSPEERAAYTAKRTEIMRRYREKKKAKMQSEEGQTPKAKPHDERQAMKEAQRQDRKTEQREERLADLSGQPDEMLQQQAKQQIASRGSRAFNYSAPDWKNFWRNKRLEAMGGGAPAAGSYEGPMENDASDSESSASSSDSESSTSSDDDEPYVPGQ